MKPGTHSRTAAMVAALRARSTAAAAPLCRDEWAAALAGEEGEGLAERMLAANPHLGLWVAARSAWLDRAEGLGAAITVRLGREELQGRFRDFGHDGALMLERPDGTVRPVVSGEIVQTVPAG